MKKKSTKMMGATKPASMMKKMMGKGMTKMSSVQKHLGKTGK